MAQYMLGDVYNIVNNDYVDVYTGYQIIAEIWKNSLFHDIELIENEGFYNVGRMREPNIVTRGTGKSKSEEQDGWNGRIIPNQLIAQFLYSEELKVLDNKRNKIQEAEIYNKVMTISYTLNLRN